MFRNSLSVLGIRMIVRRVPDDCGKLSGCNNRNVNTSYQTFRILLNFTKYLFNFHFYEERTSKPYNTLPCYHQIR